MAPDTSFHTPHAAAHVQGILLLRHRGFAFRHLIKASSRWLLLVWFLVPALSAVAAPAKDQPGLVKQEFIFDHGPAPTNHSSTIVETKSRLLAAWFGGPAARHPSNAIFTARYDGTNWSAPVQVVDGVQADGRTRYQCWNPVLFQPTRGPLLMFYKVGPSPEAWWGMMTTSTNDGRTWSKPTRLPDGFIGPVRNKPVELADGSLLCGASKESNGWAVHMERAFDAAHRWEKIPLPQSNNGLQAIQPTILPHNADVLQILCLTKEGFVAGSWSKDAGRSWSELRPTSLPNPNSALDGLRLRDGRFLIVHNDSASDRGTLSVTLSKDGRDWQKALTLESAAGEFSYPAVIQSRDGLVQITYSSNRQRIRHVALDPVKLLSGGAPGK